MNKKCHTLVAIVWGLFLIGTSIWGLMFMTPSAKLNKQLYDDVATPIKATFICDYDDNEYKYVSSYGYVIYYEPMEFPTEAVPGEELYRNVYKKKFVGIEIPTDESQFEVE